MSDMVGDLKGYVVELPKFAKYAQILKNYLASKETAIARVSLTKDRAAVGGAVGFRIHMSQNIIRTNTVYCSMPLYNH